MSTPPQQLDLVFARSASISAQHGNRYSSHCQLLGLGGGGAGV
jgi:hypothetical protein